MRRTPARRWRSSFFNWFYFVINIGALVASTVVVGVQESHGYGVGFGIPTIAFGVAIAMFVSGAVCKLYTYVPPEGSPFARIWRVFRGAATLLAGAAADCRRCGLSAMLQALLHMLARLCLQGHLPSGGCRCRRTRPSCTSRLRVTAAR